MTTNVSFADKLRLAWVSRAIKMPDRSQSSADLSLSSSDKAILAWTKSQEVPVSGHGKSQSTPDLNGHVTSDKDDLQKIADVYGAISSRQKPPAAVDDAVLPDTDTPSESQQELETIEEADSSFQDLEETETPDLTIPSKDQIREAFLSKDQAKKALNDIDKAYLVLHFQDLEDMEESRVKTLRKDQMRKVLVALREAVKPTPLVNIEFSTQLEVQAKARIAHVTALKEAVSLQWSLFEAWHTTKDLVLQDNDGEVTWELMKKKTKELYELSEKVLEDLRSYETAPNKKNLSKKSKEMLQNAIIETYLARFRDMAAAYKETVKQFETRHQSNSGLNEDASPQKSFGLLRAEKIEQEQEAKIDEMLAAISPPRSKADLSGNRAGKK